MRIDSEVNYAHFDNSSTIFDTGLMIFNNLGVWKLRILEDLNKSDFLTMQVLMEIGLSKRSESSLHSDDQWSSECMGPLSLN